MADGGISIEQLIASARDGNDHALRELFDRCREPLLAQVASECGAAEGIQSTQIVSQTLEEARDQFGQFDGSTQNHLLGWLRGILHQRSSTSAPQPPHFTHGHDATLHKPTDARTEVLYGDPAAFAAAETLSVLAGQAPSPLEETLHVQPGPQSDDAGDADRQEHSPSSPRSNSTPTKFGKYELVSMIAKGGMGVVYKARDAKLNRTVALKMILSGSFAGEGEIARFYAEAKAAAKLRHPNIVAIFDYGEVDEQPFFAMDYIEGGGLSDLVRENALPPEKAAALVKTVAEAMHYAHEKGILHRDLKPSNVLLDNAGQPMITDFGLAKQVEGHSGLTVAGTILGTPSYMPPEQAAGHIEDVQVPSDVYSIGAILYELLTGRPPFRATNAVETLKRVLDTEPVSPRLLNPGIPVDIETICLKCLQKEPAARYASAQELADELERFLVGEPILARPIGRVARLWRWCRRKPKVAALTAAAIISFFSALTASTVGYVVTSNALEDREQSLDRLQDGIYRLFTYVGDEELLNEEGLQPFRRKLLTQARDMFEETLAQEGGNSAIRHELAMSYFRLGRIMKELDAPAEALEPLDKALSLQETLVGESRTPEHRAYLGDILNERGEVLEKLSRLDDARTLYNHVIDIRESLAEEVPTAVEYSRKLANAYMNRGLIERAAAQKMTEPEAKQDRYKKSLSWLEQAQGQRTAIVKLSPQNSEIRLELAKGYYNVGNIAFEMQQMDVALANLKRGIEQFDILLNDEPDNLENQYQRALCDIRIGDVKIFSEHPEHAQDHYTEAIKRLEKLSSKNPTVHKYKGALAGAFLNQGYLQSGLQEKGQALDSYHDAQRILVPLIEQFPLPKYHADLETVKSAISELESH